MMTGAHAMPLVKVKLCADRECTQQFVLAGYTAA